MKCFRWIAAGLLALSAIACSAQGQTEKVVAIRAGHLFDSKSGKLLDNQIVLIKDDKITAVGSPDAVQIPGDAQVIDLSKSTVLPGLIDGHTHVSVSGSTASSQAGRPSQMRLMTRANTGHCLRLPTRRKIFARDSPRCAT